LDKKSQKALKIVLYVSIVTAMAGGVAAGMLFKGPVVIGVFFGVILGFFLPWVVALLSYRNIGSGLLSSPDPKVKKR